MGDATLNYRPTDAQFGDPIPFFWRGQYHLFFLRSPRTGTVLDLDWAHIVSEDLVHWQELPLALVRGVPGDPDQDGMWTGSVIERQGTFHAFYTGWARDSATPQTICHATSDDLVHWRKDPRNPILRPDPRWYDPTDYRDSFVMWNEQEGCYWMTITARRNDTPWPRRGCVALATSPDLDAWSVHPPLWKPDLAWVTECTDLFHDGDQWTLLYTTGETLCRRARTLQGPWLGSPVDTLDGNVFRAAKSLHDGKRRIVFGYASLRNGETDDGRFAYGGQLGVPRELDFDTDGSARTWPVEEAARAFSEVAYGPAELQTAVHGQPGWADDGHGLNANATSGACHLRLCEQPRNCLITCRLRLDDRAASAGLLLRMTSAGSSGSEIDLSGFAGYTLMVEPARQRVALRRWHNWSTQMPMMERPLPVEVGRWATMRVFVQDSVIEAFLDNRVALTYRLYNQRAGWLGLLAQNGQAAFADFSVRTLR